MSIEVKQEVITPEMAKKLLENNFNGQRSIINSRVDAYARDMRDGRWDEDVVAPISISDEGHLLDGQHRMQAIFVAGVPVKCWVAYGMDESSFTYIDAGKPRTANSFLGAYPNSRGLAALASRTLCLNKGASVTLALANHYPNSEMVVTGKRQNTVCAPTRAEIISYVTEHHEELSPFVAMGRSLRRLFSGGSEMTFSFACYLIGSKGYDPQLFIDDMFSLQPTSPASNLTVRTVQKSLTAQSRPTNEFLCGCILMGWESFTGLRNSNVIMKRPDKILKTRNDFYAPLSAKEEEE